MTDDRTYAWRITDQTPERAVLAAGFTSFDEPLAEWDAAGPIVASFRKEHPDVGAVDIWVWIKDSPFNAADDHLIPWVSDRDPHGNDPVPSDAARYSYGPTVGEDPAGRARADVLAAALSRYDAALGHVAARTALNVAARLADLAERRTSQ
ncbi:hypothetical protein EES43_24475 [Streptomyces sp. ADI96-02]|uniref:hypothetical protein n=1 Tax=Streptomyces sp. ADI96-02 TaxID=1522760 RepID=UPI000F557B92|nr:hypothetical protein [Streptomyces sp. ADI96-02]RPK56201.1 hypothetical protein EES43_24475 [Streptomyces sp. ADI96-02]